MPDGLTTKELDEIYQRIEKVVNPKKVKQKVILNWLISPRKAPRGDKIIHLKKTTGMRNLSRLLKEITTATIRGYHRKRVVVSGYVRTRSTWTTKQEKFIMDNPRLSIKEMANRLGKTYHSVRTKRQRLLGIKKT